ncbi:hypothetical protein BGZ46_010635 [Entomortierella lignicola]|nr:hypothetical protein BGZ46_010635 [Entomortierella lignicola]
MTRIVQGMVWLLGLSGIAMTFPNAWQVGVSLLASASVSAVLLGFAAKPSIEANQVVVDGEVGHIEEITSQYVVVRTLDERRMVVPLTWFMANIFQNWSRNSTQQIAECKLYVDYTLSVPRVRQAFLKFAREHPKYDGRHVALLVSGCTSSTIELTCQISVANAMDVIQVTSDVREAMVEFIAKQSVAATATATISALSLGDGGDGSSGSTVKSHTPPLPPLTQEDEKMGNGSKAYQTCSSTNSINVNSTLEKNYPTASEKPTAKTTALRPTPDFVRVILEEPALGGASNGLTRRSARDTETGSMSVDAVVPSIAISEPHLSEKQ